MPHHIISERIVRIVKPHELIFALMADAGLGPLPLAKKLGKASLQAPLHRYTRGMVPSPDISTARPLAKFFNLPVEAIYDEKVATAIAKERGIKVVPIPAPKPRQKKAGMSPEALWIARELDQLELTDEELQAVMEQVRDVLHARGHAIVTPPLAPLESVKPKHSASVKPKRPKRLQETSG